VGQEEGVSPEEIKALGRGWVEREDAAFAERHKNCRPEDVKTGWCETWRHRDEPSGNAWWDEKETGIAEAEDFYVEPF
jgi:hypothetical protein